MAMALTTAGAAITLLWAVPSKEKSFTVMPRQWVQVIHLIQLIPKTNGMLAKGVCCPQLLLINTQELWQLGSALTLVHRYAGADKLSLMTVFCLNLTKFQGVR